MKTKIALIALFVMIVSLTIVVQVGLYHSRSGAISFFQGQAASKPDLELFSVDRIDRNNIAQVSLAWDNQAVIHTTAPEFLSFAIDSSQLVGGKWWNPEADKVELGTGTLEAPVFDFNRPLLDTLTQGLMPAYLRLGGSEADKIYYDLTATTSADIPDGYHSVLTATQWDNLNAYVARNQLKLVFTLNTGISSRDEQGAWRSDNAEALLKYSAEQNYNVDVWELGNEVNLFWYVYGLDKTVSVEQYHQDLLKAKALVNNYYPEAMFSGQGSAYWPILGEPLGFFFGFMDQYMAKSAQLTDIVSWHYYPQQSRRGFIATRRASPSRLLDPDNLDEAAYWGQHIQDLRDQYAPSRPVWLGETGNAQFGGEPSVSDRYIGGLWWLDELGLLAKTGHDVVVRQTLSGMNYGMIDPITLQQNPDYWNSWLWKQLMGTEVYDLARPQQEELRAYMHSHPTLKGAKTLLLINLDHERSLAVELAQQLGEIKQVYNISTSDIFSTEVRINNKVVALENDQLPVLEAGNSSRSELVLPPLTYSFVVVQ